MVSWIIGKMKEVQYVASRQLDPGGFDCRSMANVCHRRSKPFKTKSLHAYRNQSYFQKPEAAPLHALSGWEELELHPSGKIF
jgi:hypothetical protein